MFAQFSFRNAVLCAFQCASCVSVKCPVTWSTHALNPKFPSNTWNMLCDSAELYNEIGPVVLIEFKFSANFQLNKIPPKIGCFVSNKSNYFWIVWHCYNTYCDHLVLFMAFHHFPPSIGKNSSCEDVIERSTARWICYKAPSREKSLALKKNSWNIISPADWGKDLERIGFLRQTRPCMLAQLPPLPRA